MMYKDKAKQREAHRLVMQRKREAVTPVTPQSCDTPGAVTPFVTPCPSDGWHDVEAYILRESPAMPNLERLQRIAGSLGSYAGEVWFGVSGLTMQDIGEVIGTQAPAYPV